MGGMPYSYVVDYEEPLQSALDRLRQREFEAGRYNPVVPFPMEDPDAAPGKQHATIKEARAAGAEDGSRSILDIVRVSDAPDFCEAAPFESAELHAIVGNARPSAEQVTVAMSALLDHVDRGMARYVIAYEDDRPMKIVFLWYSFD